MICEPKVENTKPSELNKYRARDFSVNFHEGHIKVGDMENRDLILEFKDPLPMLVRYVAFKSVTRSGSWTFYDSEYNDFRAGVGDFIRVGVSFWRCIIEDTVNKDYPDGFKVQRNLHIVHSPQMEVNYRNDIYNGNMAKFLGRLAMIRGNTLCLKGHLLNSSPASVTDIIVVD